MTGCCLLTTTVNAESAAAEIATTLVTERLAACVQEIGPVQSTYWWEGKLASAVEWLCVAKTTDQAAAAAIARIKAMHAYELPELILTPITGGDSTYLGWIGREITP